MSAGASLGQPEEELGHLEVTMGTVRVDMSMSLDGFVAGPNTDAQHPLGVGGTRLHQWLFADPQDPRDTAVSAEVRDSVGAVVLGRTTFDVGVGIWGDVPYPVPSFVLTHRGREDLMMRSGTFSFVTGGVAEAVRRAVSAAGERNVEIMGAETARQVIAAGLLDELQINLVPVLLGDGVRMFPELGGDHVELERTRVVESTAVTHLRYLVSPS
jgi:dihydrofolate reductase